MKSILALLADWANGIFSVLIVSYFYDAQPAWWYFAIGMILSHLPDLDALPDAILHGRFMSASADYVRDHREGLHYPLLLITLTGMGGYFFGFWGWVVFLNIVLHFVNDAYGTGWGIKFLWPLSSRSYKFFARRVNRPKAYLLSTRVWNTIPENERALKFLVSWSPSELPGYMRQWGMSDWISHYYLKLNPICIIEYILFVLAVTLMIMVLV